jgi:hypothetical protein
MRRLSHQDAVCPWEKVLHARRGFADGCFQGGNVGFDSVYQRTVSLSHDQEHVMTIGYRHVIGPLHSLAPFIKKTDLFLCQSCDAILEGFPGSITA